mgnify:CR=1 FL=1
MVVRGSNLETVGKLDAQEIIPLVIVDLEKAVLSIFAGESDEPSIFLVLIDVILDVQTPVITQLKVILQEDIGRVLRNPTVVVGHTHKRVDPLIERMFHDSAVGDLVFPVGRDRPRGNRGNPVVLAVINDAENVFAFGLVLQTKTCDIDIHARMLSIRPACQTQTRRTRVAGLSGRQLLSTGGGKTIVKFFFDISVLQTLFQSLFGQIIFEPDQIVLDELAMRTSLETKAHPIEVVSRIRFGRTFHTGKSVKVEVLGPGRDGIQGLSRSQRCQRHKHDEKHCNLAHCVFSF